MTKALTAIGMMSGTSMDGVDAALIETDGSDIRALGPTVSRPYTAGERKALVAALEAATALTDRDSRPGAVAAAERIVTEAHAETVERLLRDLGRAPETIDLIGFHGQTVLHRPEQRLTIQIGDGQALADRLGIDVVCDFRGRDVAAGGQGAPFVPVYHRALAGRDRLDLPIVVVNLGGVGNVTFIGKGDPLAFDTGPGNALIDDWVHQRTGEPYDADGRLAAAGTVDAAVLSELLDNPYFSEAPPKSLDRNDFSIAPVAGLSLEDGAATLAAFTAATVTGAARWFPEPARQWIVVGGGVRNPTILGMLSERLAVPVVTGEVVGWASDFIEAQAFGFMAVRSVRGLPLTFPTTTGIAAPLSGGTLVRACPAWRI